MFLGITNTLKTQQITMHQFLLKQINAVTIRYIIFTFSQKEISDDLFKNFMTNYFDSYHLTQV